MKYDELIHKINYGEDTYLNLSLEEAMTISNILLNKGYAVLLTGGDYGDYVKVSWTYAGDMDNLEYADRENIIFSSSDYLNMLVFNDYEDNDVNPYINGTEETDE